MPSDFREGITITKLPDGQTLKLRIRREDAENVKKLAAMQDVFMLEKPADINQVFSKHFRSEA
jgi:flavoprotein